MIAVEDFVGVQNTPEFTGLDLVALDRQLIALALDDIEEVNNSRKGKRRAESGLSDEELAFSLLTRELEDRQIAYSLSSALGSDAEIIADLERQEAEARRDRALAEAMSKGIPLPSSALTRPIRSGSSTPAPHSAAVTPARVFSPLGSRRASVVGSSQGLRSSLSVGFAPQIDQEVEEKPGSSSHVECVACTGRILRGSRSLRAPCDHVYDAACLKDLFEMSLTDESLFPPRCCRQEIPFEQARLLLSEALVTRFEAKSVELRTLRRVYCSVPTCSKFLGTQTDQPATIVCPSCGGTTCSGCSGPTHSANDLTCAQRLDGQAIAEVAVENGWKRCPGCRRMIELEIGCFHITCICRTHFCYRCTAIWKTCDCPQWEERRLIAAATEQVANREGPRFQANAPAARRRIAAVAERLRYNHECDHQRTRFIRGTWFSCALCHWSADQYILECVTCEMQICKRCKLNRA